MRMEFIFSEEKSKEKNIDLSVCYEVLDDYFQKREIRKLAAGLYCGDELSDGGKSVFYEAHRYFPHIHWFYQIVESWGCFSSDGQYLIKTLIHGN